MRTNDSRILDKETTNAHLDPLLRKAISLGASEAAIIASKDISVEESLANRCIDPKCMNYGLSPSCPPHVSGPEGFRKLQKTHDCAIFLRIIIPSAALFSDEHREIMQLLHEVVAGVEMEAMEMGYTNSKAFAGESCKKIFCHNHLECRVLSEKGKCRNPKYARPSMSGFGVNVFDLVKKCGWSVNIHTNETDPNAEKMSWVAGLIMIG